MYRVLVTTAALLCSVPSVSRAQAVLTLEDVVSRARAGAATVAIAQARVREAEAAALTASARFRDNAIFDVAAGPRRSAGVATTDLDVGFSQQFETGGQRRARIDAATSAVAVAEALVVRASREAVFRGASAFLKAIAATERVRIAEEADAVGRDVLSATERRYAAGDIAAIDLNLARIEGARVAGALRRARADLLEAVGELRVLLRMPAGQPVELRGSLAVRPLSPRDTLRESVARRPEFVALEAEGREADAELRLGQAMRRPDLGLRLGYAREQTDTVVLGGLTVTLPASQRGHGAIAAAGTRASRLRLELETGRESALAELDAAIAVHQERLEAADELTSQALPSVVDNEALARRSYDAGEVSLMDFLLIRRDALDTRTALVERRLEAALSRLRIDYLSGVLR